MIPFFFFQKYKNIDKYAKNFFEILVQTAFTVGLLWTILKLTPKSALLSTVRLRHVLKQAILLENSIIYILHSLNLHSLILHCLNFLLV